MQLDSASLFHEAGVVPRGDVVAAALCGEAEQRTEFERFIAADARVRRLAAEIGIAQVIAYKALPILGEIENRVRIMDNVLRFLVVRQDEQ